MVIQQAAGWASALLVLGAVGIVIAAFSELDNNEALQVLVGVVLGLPVALLLPLCAWGFGAGLEVHALRLDIASLEADLEEAVGE